MLPNAPYPLRWVAALWPHAAADQPTDSLHVVIPQLRRTTAAWPQAGAKVSRAVTDTLEQYPNASVSVSRTVADTLEQYPSVSVFASRVLIETISSTIFVAPARNVVRPLDLDRWDFVGDPGTWDRTARQYRLAALAIVPTPPRPVRLWRADDPAPEALGWGPMLRLKVDTVVSMSRHVQVWVNL